LNRDKIKEKVKILNALEELEEYLKAMNDKKTSINWWSLNSPTIEVKFSSFFKQDILFRAKLRELVEEHIVYLEGELTE